MRITACGVVKPQTWRAVFDWLRETWKRERMAESPRVLMPPNLAHSRSFLPNISSCPISSVTHSSPVGTTNLPR
jgi:hypothetical protein